MRTLCIAGVSLSLVACASTDGIEQELSRMRRDMHAMKKEIVDQRRQVERLEGRVTLLSLGKGAVQPAPRTEVAHARAAEPTRASKRAARGPDKVLPVVRLGAKPNLAEPEPAEDDDAYDTGALDRGQPPIMIKLGPSADANPKLTVDRAVLKKKDPVLHAETTTQRRLGAREQYKAALDALREDKAPQRALQMFEAFEADHPGSSLADNAAYWSGECLFVLARYEQAVARLEKMIERHPTSSKVPHAKLRVAESWLALGARDRGLAELRQLVDQHPTSEAARRAGARLEIEGGK